jgi:gamma-glutamylcyclotransferase (GGCT)/AIG2-like uncharacterized protein YtfP
MSLRLRQIWSDEHSRRSMMAALRVWNRALYSGSEAEKERAVALMKEVWTAPGAEPKTRTTVAVEVVERLLDFPSCRLAVYGSLAPGKKNHHMMAGMEGTWRKATLRGSLLNRGWGAGQGYLGFAWDGTETPIPAQVFTSRDLPQHWQRLDEFEGAEYRRVLVPVELLPQQAKSGLAGDPAVEGGEIEVCNVYELELESP